MSGHGFVIITPGVESVGDLFPGTPPVWECLRCGQVTETPSLAEPCTGDLLGGAA